jgi:hypothetical protein
MGIVCVGCVFVESRRVPLEACVTVISPDM